MSKRSVLFLFLLLGLPLVLFLFLRIFGENRFQEIPIYYSDGLPPGYDCPVGRVPNFAWTDQVGKDTNQSVLDNKISVINFFFVGCSPACQKSLDQQARAYNHFRGHQQIQFLSISFGSTDKLDSLSEYSTVFGADPTQWRFLAGSQPTILDFARCGLVLDTELEKFRRGESDLVVLDGQRRIRGYYDPGLEEEVDRMITELQILALNYNQ